MKEEKYKIINGKVETIEVAQKLQKEQEKKARVEALKLQKNKNKKSY